MLVVGIIEVVAKVYCGGRPVSGNGQDMAVELKVLNFVQRIRIIVFEQAGQVHGTPVRQCQYVGYRIVGKLLTVGIVQVTG